MKYIFYYDYKICNLLNLKFGIAEEKGYIVRIIFDWTNKKISDDFKKTETPLIKNAALQLKEYFEGKTKIFDLPLSLNGTDFQLKVWKALQNLPYGETRSYGELAALAGNPRASRAIGMANNRNPIPVIIPCHRIIGSDGNLTGYAGGLELKQKLLELEKTFVNKH
jgi:methylated-DNA-[protein]-cysteine S-methyltransferase